MSHEALAPADVHTALFTDHYPWLLGRLYLRLRNRAEAEDVASETLLRVIAYRRAATLKEPRAYLTSVAKSVLRQSWRHRDIERLYAESVAHMPEALALSAEDHAILLESLTRISSALDGLPALARQAFLLSQLDGLTYAEIAVRLDRSVATVRYYMAQGLRQCLLALDDD
jgi:RNA polymerase sigma factor (sigma-70 family)